jgi:murein DD-endopeptidase MepM/ murein hydrolase activator NlpD
MADWRALLFVLACSWPLISAAEEPSGRYVLSYPAAEQFCPPVDGFFEEVHRTIDRTRGHTFRHQPNGGYGLPVVDKVRDTHLIHLGADVGFYRVGEPVYAVANGVVRISQGPPKEDAKKKQPKPAKALEWGNVVVLEHQLAGGKFATTIYGNLANDRLVAAGDVVQAGQQIGTIGATRVNGGYKPHLHFGVREGRMAAVGRKLLVMTMDGKPTTLEIAELRDDNIVLTGASDWPDQLQMGLDGRKFKIGKRDNKAEVSAEFLSYVPSPEFMIVGYGLSTDGWLDPILFLKGHGADINPAAFARAPLKNQLRSVGSAANRDKVMPTKKE